MNTFLRLDQHAMGLHDANDGPISWIRLAARAVLVDEHGRIAVMHFTRTGSYKLPGGGIDEGEEHTAALRRELQEETGYEVADIKELGAVDENRYFCGMNQISYCYTARPTHHVGTALTEKEAHEGMNLQWASSIDEAIAWIESGTTTDEDGSAVGLAMMKARDCAILRAAQEQLAA
ncbi:MAG TPA: NUDIX domain-containing protein [Candidatus Saccharimonas sp.]|nr:NUDIX domain-containing protein [Candidatus Saccharimonas sp.]